MSNHYSTRPAPPSIICAAFCNFFRLPGLIVLLLLLLSGKSWAQTTVFTDNFDRTPLGTTGGTPAMTWTTNTTASSASVFTTTVTTLPNYVFQIYTGATPAAGRSYMTGPLSTYSSPFVTTLGTNTGPVTWTFNMKTNRTTALSGFDAGNCGSAVILSMTSADPTNTSTNGYAVVLVKGTTRNAIKLVRFANGMVLNSNLTTIIGPSPDLAAMTNYVSVKVIYSPASGTWELFVRDDASTTDPMDPTTGTLTQVGSGVVNTTYTSVAMSSCGFLWNHSNGAGSSNKGIFDNFSVTVTPVLTPTLSAVPSTLSGFNYVSGSGPSVSQSYSLSGVNLTGAPGNIAVGCTTNYEVSTDNSNFFSSVNVGYSTATLAPTAVYVRLKAGLAVAGYNSEIITNAGGGAATQNVSCSGFVLGAPTPYAWTGATDNNWTVASNWSPARTSPAINDILQFNNGNTYTVTNVPTQTLAQLLVSAGSKITLQSSSSAILTVAGTTDDDFTVMGSSSELNVSGTNTLSLSINAGANGLVNGSMTFSGAAHLLKATDVSSLIISNGGIIKATTGFTGSVFGTTSLNSVKFQTGSTYIQDAGSNPFGAGAPNSVVVFETGSLYKFTAATGGPSYSGRTYPNFENDAPLAIQNNQGSNPMTCDNYTVTSGTVNWDFTGGVVIKGNISVSAAATLTFGNATKVTNLTLNGSAPQTISGSGTMVFGANGTLTVGNTAGVVLSSNATLNNLTIVSGTFTVASGASLITNGTVTGDVTVERNFTSGASAWHMFCLPTSTGFSASPLFDGAYVDEYFQNTGVWHRLVTASTVNAMTGYSVNFPSGVHTLAFTGTVNTGDQTFSGLGYSSGASGYGPGWNLVGNTFPSAVDLTLGSWTKTNLDGFVYVWDGAQYVCGPTTYGALGTLTNNIIPAMQGFFVKATSDGATLTIPQASRVHSSSFYKNTESLSNVLSLSVSGNGYQDKAVVMFNEAASTGFDSDYDAYKLLGIAEAPQLYSIIPDNKLTVNSLPSIVADAGVALGIVVGVQASYTFTASGIESFETSTPVLLEDLKANTTQDLRQNPVYSFIAAPGDDQHRFNLIFKQPTGISEIDRSLVAIFSNRDEVNIRNPKSLQGSVEMFDVTGRLINRSLLSGSMLEKIHMANHSGIVVVKVVSEKGVFTGKVFVN
jgi:hypothetical protein